MADQLVDKVVVVVGASAGIGLAVSRRCAAEGAHVVMLARGRERLEAAADEIGERATAMVCDVTDPENVRTAFAEIAARFDKVDVLLNVAGVARIRRIENASDDDIAFVLGVNLLGPIYTTRAAIPLMRVAGAGDIVNVSSEIVDDYLPRMVLYGTAKGGLDTFSRMMVHELQADNIRVTRYTSGAVADTAFGDNFGAGEVEAAYPEWDASGYLTRVAGPGMDPDWMAEAIVFAITRPRGQMIDVVHVRSFAPGHATESAEVNAAPPGSATGTAQLSHRQVLRVLTGLMTGMFLAAVESTIIATAAPTIVEDLGGIHLITWIFTAYMLTTTVSAALWGKLSDLVGRRATYLGAIAIFVAGSLLAGAAQTMTQLIVFRGLQGVGGGGLGALSFTIMADILPPRRRGRYVGYFSATFALGSVIGPLIGGLLVDWFNWRVIFLINLPLGVIAAAISSSALRGVGGRRKARLDIAGALTLSAAIVCLLLIGVWGGNEYGWVSTEIIGLGIAAVVLLVAFVAIEQRAAEPVLAVRLLRNRTLVLSMIIAGLTTVPFNAAVVYLPLFFQTVHHVGVSRSGLQLAPLMVTMSVASIVTGRRVTSTGRYKRLLYVGLLVGMANAVWLATIDAGTGTGTTVVMMVLLGVSFGMSAPIVNLTAQNAMPIADLGAASSALITFRSLGTTVGIAGVGSVLLARLRSGVADLPGGGGLDVDAIASGPATIAALAEPLRSGVIDAMASAIATGMAVCIPLVVAAFVVMLWFPELPLRDSTEIEIS